MTSWLLGSHVELLQRGFSAKCATRSHVPASGPMVTGLNGLNGNKHWFTASRFDLEPSSLGSI